MLIIDPHVPLPIGLSRTAEWLGWSGARHDICLLRHSQDKVDVLFPCPNRAGRHLQGDTWNGWRNGEWTHWWWWIFLFFHFVVSWLEFTLKHRLNCLQLVFVVVVRSQRSGWNTLTPFQWHQPCVSWKPASCLCPLSLETSKSYFILAPSHSNIKIPTPVLQRSVTLCNLNVLHP